MQFSMKTSISLIHKPCGSLLAVELHSEERVTLNGNNKISMALILQ